MIEKKDFEDGSLTIEVDGWNMALERVHYFKVFHSWLDFLEYYNTTKNSVLTFTIAD